MVFVHVLLTIVAMFRLGDFLVGFVGHSMQKVSSENGFEIRDLRGWKGAGKYRVV